MLSRSGYPLIKPNRRWAYHLDGVRGSTGRSKAWAFPSQEENASRSFPWGNELRSGRFGDRLGRTICRAVVRGSQVPNLVPHSPEPGHDRRTFPEDLLCPSAIDGHAIDGHTLPFPDLPSRRSNDTILRRIRLSSGRQAPTISPDGAMHRDPRLEAESGRA